MDLNQSMEFTPPAASSPQIHNFMPMTSFMLPFHQPSNENGEEVKQSHLLAQKRNLELFWYQQMMDIHNISAFKSHHQLPLARIKRVMKSDKDVKMISADTPILFSKACELFIQELTLRAWLKTEEGNRRTLQRCDIIRAIRQEEALHFLVDAVPLINHKDDDGKFLEENEYHPANQLQFPVLDMNFEVAMSNPEAQQFMSKPPMSSNDFN
ncbi:Nuclear transcription factor Y subunit C-1 [Hibiscus syriacus]|uniref:Nuclear transcription factor Y subunit C-1 n=1 Tax=Hibiscus syriacus TaxID=106335 RepID=A0A6A2WKL5_HIBSY|nr:Nuclear transcription factor Y subunit C-1 [Hibiscus syriacus]